MKTVDALLLELEAEGYLAGPPKHIRRACLEIDEEVATAASCPRCESGLEFRPFHREKSYRALGVCPGCGHAEEF